MTITNLIKKTISTSVAAILCLPVFGNSNLNSDYKKLKTTTEKRMQAIDFKLEKLVKRISSLKGNSKKKMNDNYKDLLALKNDLTEKLVQAKDTTADQWTSSKEKIESFADDIELRLEKAMR